VYDLAMEDTVPCIAPCKLYCKQTCTDHTQTPIVRADIQIGCVIGGEKKFVVL